MSTRLTREQVERTCTRLRYPSGAGGEKEPALQALLNEDAALREELEKVQESLTCWREWVQFVWKDGGPAIGSDAVLQSHVCHEFDSLKQQLAQTQAENARLREALKPFAGVWLVLRTSEMPFRNAVDMLYRVDFQQAQAALDTGKM